MSKTNKVDEILVFNDNPKEIHKGDRLRIKRNKIYEYFIVHRKRLNKVWLFRGEE